jgi:hypothetical protein
MGITVCGRDKTIAKLASINCYLGATLLAPATYLSLTTTVEACKPFKAECVNLRNYLLHVFMHGVLLRHEMCKLLLYLLSQNGSHQSNQLALVHQRRHLRCNRIRRLFI